MDRMDRQEREAYEREARSLRKAMAAALHAKKRYRIVEDHIEETDKEDDDE